MSYWHWNHADLSTLIGMTMTSVENTGDEITFKTNDGRTFKLYHEQDCCEGVSVDDVCGDLEDLVGSPILTAEEVSNTDVGFTDPYEGLPDYWSSPDDYKGEHAPESYTWTFYKFSTIKGSVTIRWYGSSNGYYSESVSFSELPVERPSIIPNVAA